MLGPFATASRRTRHSPGVATDAACASMSTTTPTTTTTTTTTTATTTTRDRGDRYGRIEWAQQTAISFLYLFYMNLKAHVAYAISTVVYTF